MINVVNNNGARIGQTYIKRARGLIKKGRAHFISEDTICLEESVFLNDFDENPHMRPCIDCHDNYGNTEDIEMDKNNFTDVFEEAYEANKETNTDNSDMNYADSENNNSTKPKNAFSLLKKFSGFEFTNEYIASRLDMIIEDTQHIHEALLNIGQMQINECPNGGSGDAARANAIQTAVKAREETNQQVLHFLEHIYNDINNHGNSNDEKNNITNEKDSMEYQLKSQIVDSLTYMMQNTDTDNGDSIDRIKDMVVEVLRNL